jgi:hypothetical protein
MFEFFICFALVLAILEIVKNFNVAKVQFTSFAVFKCA